MILGPCPKVAKSTSLLPLASGESLFWCPSKWTMAILLGNHIASKRNKISSLLLISFSAEVSNLLFLYSPMDMGHGESIF